MASKTPAGITPPAPGLAREEPDLWLEDDIPTDGDDTAAAVDSTGAEPRERQ